MKRILTLLILAIVLFIPSIAAADTIQLDREFNSELDHDGAVGAWRLESGRLYQNNTQEKLAKVNFQVPQRGTMEYRFHVRYEDGGITDRKGGFGIHVFVDDPFAKRSWGDGESYLLWINYDPEATYGRPGFVAQVYQSENPFTMEILDDYQMSLDTSMLRREYLSMDIPIRIQVNGNTGLVKVFDPRRDGYYYKFRLPVPPRKGSHVALRTNSLAVSFEDLLIKRVR